MAPPRILFPGATHHLGSRGSTRQSIVWDVADRERWLRLLDRVATRHGWRVLAYCLMTNHYHLVLRDPGCTLSAGMRELNSVFSRATNARHGRDAHLFRNRFWSRLVDTDEYLLTALRYNDRNPVDEGLCDRPSDWPWSSHRAIVGLREAPPWLAADDVLRLFGRDRRTAIRRYRDYVERDVRADMSAGQTSVTEV
jgi:REP element-mobilizing transposase RayT